MDTSIFRRRRQLSPNWSGDDDDTARRGEEGEREGRGEEDLKACNYGPLMWAGREREREREREKETEEKGGEDEGKSVASMPYATGRAGGREGAMSGRAEAQRTTQETED